MLVYTNKHMKKLHEFLKQESSAYEAWHKNPAHPIVHYLVVALAVLVAYTAIFSASHTNRAAQSVVGQQSVEAKASNVTDLNKQLIALSTHYDAALDDESKSSIASAIIGVINARRSQMKAEIANDPQQFLKHAFSKGTLKKLPESVQALLEQEADMSGTISMYHIDNFTTGKGEVVFELAADAASGGGKYKLHFSGKLPKTKTGDKVRVKGVSLDDDVLVASAPAGSGSNDPGFEVTTPSAAAPTVRNGIIIAFNFNNDSSQPFTLAQLSNTFLNITKSTNTFYHENSFDQLNFTLATSGWFTIPFSNSNCGAYQSWMAAADSAAIAAGYNVNSYTNKIYVMPRTTSCNWGGLGLIGGNPSWLMDNGYNDPSLFAHELGHNLTNWHAQSFSCGNKPIAPYANCTTSEYGDPSSVMGLNWNSYFHFNAPEKANSGWLTSQTVTDSGTYTLAPIESPSDTIARSIRLLKPDTGDYYYLTYHQPMGWFDSTMPSAFLNGVSVSIWGPGNTPSKLLDMTPGDGTFLNAPLADGKTFTDTANGITISQLSHTGGAATLAISFGGIPCVTQPPSVSLNPYSGSGSAGETVGYNLNLYNNDSSGCTNSNFNISGIVPAGWTVTPSVTSVLVSPGHAVLVPFAVTPPTNATNGIYPLSFVVTDPSKTNHGATGQAEYVLYNAIPPVITFNSPQDGDVITASSVIVSVTSTHADGVKTLVINIDNKDVKTCNSTKASVTCAYTWKIGDSKVPSGPHTIKATAQSNGIPTEIATKSITVIKQIPGGMTLSVSKQGTGGGLVTSSPAGINCGDDCSADYVKGANVTLTAVADGYSKFDGWSGACSGTNKTCKVAMKTPLAVVATFTQTSNPPPAQMQLQVSKTGSGSGTVTSAPAGINCGSTCSASYNSGTNVTLTATPASGSTFVGWSGACSGTGSCTVTMNSAKTVTAQFNVVTSNPTLSVTKSGTGTGTVMSAPSGINCGSTCSASYASGTSVSLTAVPGPGSVFVSWSGACAGSGDCYVTMNSNVAVGAQFNIVGTGTSKLSFSKSGNTDGGTVTSSPAGINCGPTCSSQSADFSNGTTVTLVASANPGYKLSYWGGACWDTSSTCTVSMSTAKTVTARFDFIGNPGFVLTLTKLGTGEGQVFDPDLNIYCHFTCPGYSANITPPGKVITLSAYPKDGSTFTGWGGACSGTGSCTVIVDQAKTVTAQFNLQ